MGSNHDTTATARRRRVATIGTAIAALAALGLAACTSSGDDDASGIDQAAAATTAAGAFVPPTTIPASALADSSSAASEATVPAARGSIGTIPMQVIGQDLAITARATLQTTDVPGAVDSINSTVTLHGGHVTSADIDYGEAEGSAPTTTAPGGDPGPAPHATLVIAIPPGELGAVQQTLDDVGEVQSFVQQAEDVTDQLTDLDTRITNQRASVARIRELYATATDVEAIVRIEGELTNRETALEQLLATQSNLQGRVAMSTLTIDITATPTDPAASAPADDDDGTTIGDALGAGWSAFAGALFAIALVLTAAMPFLLLVGGIGVIVWLVLRRVRRPRPTVTAPTTPEPEREEAVASRPG